MPLDGCCRLTFLRLDPYLSHPRFDEMPARSFDQRFESGAFRLELGGGLVP